MLLFNTGVFHEICCGLDLHKDIIVACILSGPVDEEPVVHLRSFGTMYSDLQTLGEWLHSHHCENVAMESTGALWMSVYNSLTDQGVCCSVVNAQQSRHLPGRKTDWNDAQWIALLYRHGMVNRSYVPDRNIQTLRHYTRTMETLAQDESRDKNRIEKLLQMNGYKLSSVVSDIFGQTGLRLMQRLVEKGRIVYRDVEELRDPNCKHTAREIAHAMQGTMNEAERKLLGFKLRQLEAYSVQMRELQAMIDALIQPYAAAVDLVDSIPGIGHQAAVQIIGEIGLDMDSFRSAEQLCAWAGVSPRNDKSAEKKSPPASCQETAT